MLRGLSLFLAAQVIGFPTSATAPAPEMTEPRRPNIILITAEDLGPRLRFMGDQTAVTPNLDKLARESIMFTHAFTTAGVCAPSRSALITGVHQQTLGTHHMRTGSYGENMAEGFPYQAVPPAHIKAFPELLRAAGYLTVNDAKTDYQFGQPFTVWDINRAGADWNKRRSGQPFFAMINHEVTHESRTWPSDTDTTLHPIVATRAKLNKQIDADKTFVLTDPASVHIPPYWPDTQKVRDNLARFYDNIRLMDDQVGSLLARLEAEGRLRDSIVIFTTDHGDGLPRHKRTIFDSGTRVPLLIRFPDGYGAGTQRNDLVSFVDIAPTILTWAGVPVPAWVQGRPIFDSPAPTAVFMGGDRFDEVPQRFRGVREQRWHYIRYFSNTPVIPALRFQNVNPIMQEMRRLHATGGLTPLQASYLDVPSENEFLFDTQSDPDEIVNLARDGRYASIKQRLAGQMDRWISYSGDLGRLKEQDIVAAMWPGGQQPVTAHVTACLAEEGSGNMSIRLMSATFGASIGWGGEEGESNLYRGPLDLETPFAARSIRYGYAPSPVTRIRPTELARCDDRTSTAKQDRLPVHSR